MAQGWISIHRQLQSHWLWDDKPFSKGQAWIDMLLLANHSDNKFLLGNELLEVKTGSFVTSELKLMDRWGWSKAKVRAFLTMLEQDGMIIKKTDRKKTTIFIEKYSVFQDIETTERPRKNHKKTTKEPQKDTNNNDNNVNNDNKIIYIDDSALNQAIIEFVAHRKSIKKPMSDHAVKLMISKLKKMTSNVDEQVEIINQSIVNGWQGIFPLKEEGKGKKRPQSKGTKFSNFNQRDYDFEAMERMLLEGQNPADDTSDPEFLKKAEEMQERMKAKYSKTS